MVTRSERIDYFKAALGYHLNFELDLEATKREMKGK